MTGYLLETKGEASLARNGWFAIIRATGLVVEKSRREGLESYLLSTNLRSLMVVGPNLRIALRRGCEALLNSS